MLRPDGGAPPHTLRAPRLPLSRFADEGRTCLRLRVPSYGQLAGRVHVTGPMPGMLWEGKVGDGRAGAVGWRAASIWVSRAVRRPVRTADGVPCPDGVGGLAAPLLLGDAQASWRRRVTSAVR